MHCDCVCVRPWLGVSVGGSACTVWSECVCDSLTHTHTRQRDIQTGCHSGWQPESVARESRMRNDFRTQKH